LVEGIPILQGPHADLKVGIVHHPRYQTRKAKAMFSLSGSGLQGLITVLAGLGTLVQFVVLAVLLGVSVVCWGIILHKASLLRKASRHSARFLDALHSSNDLAFAAAAARRFALSPLARLFRAAHQRLEMLSEGRFATADDDPASAVAGTTSRLRHMLRLAQSEEMARLEHGLPFLATTASVTPFVGLFGTVWGIMQSFHAIGQRGGASLAVVGPGISEALIATAAGLAAAIPAVVAYNHYLNRVRRIEGELEHFAEELVLLFDNRLPHDVQRVSHRASDQR
jgi:biopolymer transport protein TolQ